MRNQYAAHVDFTELVGVIPTNPKFLASDIDMVYERNGHFLFAEWKRPGEQYGRGQHIMLRALAQMPNIMVICVNGYSDNRALFVDVIHWLKPTGEIVRAGHGLERLKEIIRNWYAKANA